MRERVFWITIGFATIVDIAGIVIAVRTPDLEKLTEVNIPLSVICFGLLGAVLCGLHGIIQHGDISTQASITGTSRDRWCALS